MTEVGCSHRIEVVGQRKPRDLPQFNWVNIVLGNVQTMLSGAYKAFKYRKYATCYLGASTAASTGDSISPTWWCA